MGLFSKKKKETESHADRKARLQSVLEQLKLNPESYLFDDMEEFEVSLVDDMDGIVNCYQHPSPLDVSDFDIIFLKVKKNGFKTLIAYKIGRSERTIRAFIDDLVEICGPDTEGKKLFGHGDLVYVEGTNEKGNEMLDRKWALRNWGLTYYDVSAGFERTKDLNLDQYVIVSEKS